MLSEVIELITQHQRFVLTTHTNPDLDAIGSELALDELLRQLGKESLILNSDGVPSSSGFVDEEHRVLVYSAKRHRKAIVRAEVIVVLDVSGGWRRVGRISEDLSTAEATVVRIDHHPDPTPFAPVNLVDTDAAATAELVFDIVQEANGVLTQSMARALYVAILTDTGSFRYPKTSPKTHRIAAELLERGANPTLLYKQIYEQNPLNWTRLKGHVLDSFQLSLDGKIACCVLDQDTLKQYEMLPADLNGFPGLGMEIGGVRVSILCVEMPNGQVKVSLRSDGGVAVNDLAAEWGGGGHASAAGLTLRGNLNDVARQVVARIQGLIQVG